ncbi:ugd [Wigglesworthia glossinidia endosymbiont of Glossina brevipalpis]|uniref:UDP-glucose 6-dehydrogenase n=1 Tax=Wigglesworthia glossinidia brevipalpis TaxID=36870 RepID=Q8D2I6_WIGBR|nr:ugd [Wigglesworthia glossinidia endosymbiont of Glossina brevipalpis]
MFLIKIRNIKMKVTVFGIGYVGLVQAAVLAEIGHSVLCVESNQDKLSDLKKGIVPIYEPGLKTLIKKNLKLNRLKFTNNHKDGVNHGVMQFITVGTPIEKNKIINTIEVYKVAEIIANNMRDYKIILEKSTVPVGTTEKIFSFVKKILKNKKRKLKFDVVYNPEFLKEGTAVYDCMFPNKIIIGTNNINLKSVLKRLYDPFDKKQNCIIFMDIRSAELTKYASNCMLATKISFMNEMSNLAEIFGADIENVRKSIGKDPRIGDNYIYPGCGYGGSCFPKDIRGLIYASKMLGYQPKLLEAVEEINNKQKNKIFELIKYHFGKNLNKKTFALWGLSFKPNTNDVREASSIILIESLWKYGAKIQAFDPKAMEEIHKIYGNRKDFVLMKSKESVLNHADALIICTEWKNFYFPNFKKIKSKLKQPVIFDGRNLYDPKYLKNKGFIYYGIGRGDSLSMINN